ncbi:hypothetical protein [Nocardia sp. NPDC050406]|uniref:TPR repeat region-containing protein n=1 Tax=Nocardia sp. NPDC050406 TaxID=3364318 RepID=UPI0037AD2ACA
MTDALRGLAGVLNGNWYAIEAPLQRAKIAMDALGKAGFPIAEGTPIPSEYVITDDTVIGATAWRDLDESKKAEIKGLIFDLTDGAAAARTADDTLREQLKTQAAAQFTPLTDAAVLGASQGRAQIDDVVRAGERGREDGRALAEWADGPTPDQDPAVLARVAGQLPDHPLTDAQLRTLASGGEVDTLPRQVQDYYRAFYNAAGKDGVLALSEYLKDQEESGSTVAASQRDTLANGLAVISNEDIGTGRTPDGKLIGAGSYQDLPADIRELIEARRTDPDPIDPATPGGPLVALQKQWQDTNALASLLAETNPGYEPGTELGTQLYLKSADMVQDQYNPPDLGRDTAAGAFTEFAGRNNDAAHRIWTGDGMPHDYDAKETVRTLTGHDWSNSDKGRGAATLIDRITEEARLPLDDPRGMRGREALAGLGTMLCPDDKGDTVWAEQKDSFARNPELATAVGKAVAGNLDAVSGTVWTTGFPENSVMPDGRVSWQAEEANRLLQLGSYSEEGRLNITTAVEQHRTAELTQLMREHPDQLPNALALSDAGALSGRVDNAMWDALIHQDQLKGQEALNPTDALYQAKMLGASIAGQLADEAVGKIPHADIGTGALDLEVGDAVEGKVQEWLGKPEYEFMERPSEAVLKSEATDNAHQAILNAAYATGTLPPTLRTDDGPLDMATIRRNSLAQNDFTSFLTTTGLGQYVTDYCQSYAIDLGQQGGS